MKVHITGFVPAQINSKSSYKSTCMTGMKLEIQET